MRQITPFVYKSAIALLAAGGFIGLVFVLAIVRSSGAYSTDGKNLLPPMPHEVPLKFALLLLVFLILVVSGFSVLFSQKKFKAALLEVLKPTMVKVHFLIYCTVFFAIYMYDPASRPNLYPHWTITGSQPASDSLLAYLYPPNSERHEVVVTLQGDTMINAVYHFDSLSRRRMPAGKNVNKATLFFGCSYTFGLGINDDETIPYQYYMQDTNENVYDYALDGWGPQQTYQILRSRTLRKEVQGDTMTGIFIFLDDHIKRVICDKNHINSWTKNFPCFELEHDSLVYKGTMAMAHPTRVFLYNLMMQMKLFDHVNIPSTPGEDAYLTTTAIIKQSATSFARQFKSTKFYVVIYPGQDPRISTYLVKEGLTVIDLSKFFKDPEAMLFPFQRHPTPEATKLISQEIYRRINQVQ